jgi:hypothetical protein
MITGKNSAMKGFTLFILIVWAIAVFAIIILMDKAKWLVGLINMAIIVIPCVFLYFAWSGNSWFMKQLQKLINS